ncbi:MAG: hypothetical protein HYV09_30860 [Deltaproteobacteria bacterium]|nr:hypothetical protein [Deltaproteobacteria bacterium]
MDEREGSQRLRIIFESAGCTIADDAPLSLGARPGAGGAERIVTLDGWDEARRIGYEFITTDAGDRAEFTPEVVAELEAKMHAGELWVFLVDEADIPDPAVLERAAQRFLDALRARGVLP